MRKIPASRRAIIIQKLKNGFSCRQIARQEHVAPNTVGNIAKSENIAINKHTRGRPVKFSAADGRIMSRLIVSGQSKTAVDVHREMQNIYKVDSSLRTVQKTLKKLGFRAKKKVYKPYLSAKHRKARGGNIMLWGCFCATGVGELFRTEGNMNANDYIQIINTRYLKSLKTFRLEVRSSILQQDNDPKHVAKKTLEFFKKKQIKVLKWPAQSPDLNPIENLWHIMKRQLYGYAEQAKTKDELWERCKDVWQSISVETCKNLSESMPRRIEAVIKSKGGHTKY